jgi:putative transposase
MTRLLQFDLPDVPHHVIQRGTDRCLIFRDDRDYRFFLNCLWDASVRYHCDVHAHVLMTNHFHFLMTAHAERGLSKLMQSVGSRYVPYFNARHGRTGTLWQGRPRLTPVETDEYFLVCSRYIELNPVRAGMVSNPGDYPWSSYAHHALGLTDPLIRDHEIVTSLGGTPAERCAAYLALFNGAVDEAALPAIRDATNHGWALGNKQFRDRIQALSQRRAAPLPRGGSRARNSVGPY